MGLHEQNHQTPDSTVRAKPIEYFLLVSNYLSDTLIWLHVPAHILCENWKNQCIRNIARVFWCKCKQWTKTNNKGKIGILVPQLYPEGQVCHSTFKLANIVPQLLFSDQTRPMLILWSIIWDKCKSPLYPWFLFPLINLV